MRPVIAIPQMGNSLFRKYMKKQYARSLVRAGAEVRWIELKDIQQAVNEALSCDGLLMPGGADINPEMYGEKPNKQCKKPNKVRDDAEPVILEEFLKTGKPVFAICRGIQLLNVYKKGTLLQDIKKEQKYKHMDFISRAGSTHPIFIDNNSIIYDILKIETTDVNSMHHQAIKAVGNGLKVTAKSEDGYIEAVELENHPFCIGVQWHPEHMSKKMHCKEKYLQLLFRRVKTKCQEI